MKASLTLDQPATGTKASAEAGRKTALRDLIKPTRGAPAARVARTPAQGPSTAAPTTLVQSPDSLPAADRLRHRLATVAPQLFDRSRPRNDAKLIEILAKRLGALITDATSRVRARLAAAAAALATGERASLQDALLLSRVTAEELMPAAIDCFTPGELFALLATGCLAHAPEQLDALRCHDIVCGGHQLLAREAVLDLVAQGPDEASTRHLETLVERRIARRVAAVSASAGALLDGLADPLAPARDGGAVRHSREDMAASERERLMAALRRGNDDDAVDVLAKTAGVSRSAIRTAVFLRTAKGLASLAWRGGFDARAAVAIQSALGHVAPDEIIHPTAQGEFALSHAEMLWQCRFLAHAMPASLA